jgi:hypothetical protein
MPVQYNVDGNALTSPPTYYPRVKPVLTLDEQALAEQINLHNPNIPVSSAVAMIGIMTDEIKRQLIAGNWVKIDSFCSFSTSITDAVMSSPDEDLPAGFKIKLNFKASAPFVTDVRTNATVEKVGYIDKTPQIVAERNQAIGIMDVWDGYVPVRLSGMNLRFNPAASDEGVFLTVDGGSETRLTNVAQNDPSQIIVFPDSAGYLTLQETVAAKIAVRTSFTTNGQLRSIVYSRDIRGVNRMLTTDTGIDVFKPYGVAAFMTLTPTVAASALYTLEKKNTGEIVIYRQVITNNIVGAASTEVDITGNAAYTLVTGYTFTGSDFTALSAWIATQGNFVQEQIIVSAP